MILSLVLEKSSPLGMTGSLGRGRGVGQGSHCPYKKFPRITEVGLWLSAEVNKGSPSPSLYLPSALNEIVLKSFIWPNLISSGVSSLNYINTQNKPQILGAQNLQFLTQGPQTLGTQMRTLCTDSCSTCTTKACFKGSIIVNFIDKMLHSKKFL